MAAESNEPVLAAQSESFYRQLYAIEERGKTLLPDERRDLRQRGLGKLLCSLTAPRRRGLTSRDRRDSHLQFRQR